MGEYWIDHPDFVLAAASDAPQVISEERDGSLHFLSVLFMTSLEQVPAVAHAQAA